MKHKLAVVTREAGDPEVRVAQGWLVPTGVGVGEEYATVRAVDYAALQDQVHDLESMVDDLESMAWHDRGDGTKVAYRNLAEAEKMLREEAANEKIGLERGILGLGALLDEQRDQITTLQSRLLALVEAARPLHDAWKDQLSVGIEMEPKGTKILVKATDMAALAKAVEEADQ